MGPSSRKRCYRINQPGQGHALTFSCFHRQPFLSKDRSRNWLINAIQLAKEKHSFDLWAYVIMPEHAHILFLPTQKEYSISHILSTMKQSVSKRALLYVRENAPQFLERMRDTQPNGTTQYRFWQRGGGYDRNLFEQKTIHDTINYIHMNPVRRGLCQKPEEWAWSSAIEYKEPGKGLLRIDKESLPREIS